MELDSEAVLIRIIHAFAAAVIGVPEGFSSDALQGVGDDSVAVVLGSDIGPAGGKILHRLVAAPVAVFQLDGVAAQGQGCQLMPQADSEDRFLSYDLLQNPG